MTTITTAEAERLAVLADEVFADLPWLMGRASREGHAAGQDLASLTRPKLIHTAAALRSLSAERDALALDRDQQKEALRQCLLDAQRLIAERDALAAECARLREALRPFADALAEGEQKPGDTLVKLKEALMHISYGKLKAARAALGARAS